MWLFFKKMWLNSTFELLPQEAPSIAKTISRNWQHWAGWISLILSAFFVFANYRKLGTLYECPQSKFQNQVDVILSCFFLASHFSWPLATQSFQPVLWSQGIPFLALSVIVVLENFLAQLFSHSEPPWLMLHRIVICVGIISFARVSSRSCSWLVTLLPSAISYLVTTIDHLVSRSRDSAAFSVYSLHILQKPYLSSDFLQMIR